MMDPNHIHIRPYLHLDAFNHPNAMRLVAKFEGNGKSLAALCESLLERGASAMLKDEGLGNRPDPPAGVGMGPSADTIQPGVPATNTQPAPDSESGPTATPTPQMQWTLPPADVLSEFLSLPSSTESGA